MIKVGSRVRSNKDAENCGSYKGKIEKGKVYTVTKFTKADSSYRDCIHVDNQEFGFFKHDFTELIPLIFEYRVFVRTKENGYTDIKKEFCESFDKLDEAEDYCSKSCTSNTQGALNYKIIHSEENVFEFYLDEDDEYGAIYNIEKYELKTLDRLQKLAYRTRKQLEMGVGDNDWDAFVDPPDCVEEWLIKKLEEFCNLIEEK